MSLRLARFYQISNQSITKYNIHQQLTRNQIICNKNQNKNNLSKVA